MALYQLSGPKRGCDFGPGFPEVTEMTAGDSRVGRLSPLFPLLSFSSQAAVNVFKMSLEWHL